MCQMQMVPGLDRKIVPLRKHPNATGFMPNLYKIDGVPQEIAQHLEIEFMRPLDTEASIALDLILAGQALDERQRSAWTRYAVSRMFRHPFAVNFVNDHFRLVGAGIDVTRSIVCAARSATRHRLADDRNPSVSQAVYPTPATPVLNGPDQRQSSACQRSSDTLDRCR
jgi:hypothetical protein